MNKILVLNNYSVTSVLAEVNNNIKPSHHLYGVAQLKQMGYEIITFDTDSRSLFYKLGKLLSRVPLCNIGDLYLQVNALRIRSNYDFIYAPCQDVTIFLGVLNYFKLFDKPIIALAHHPFLKGRFSKLRKYSLFFSLRGHCQFPSLSSTVAKQINIIAKKNISKYLPWGPDLEYYLAIKQVSPYTQKKYDLIAIGRTGRDFVSFIKAFSNTSFKIAIYCNKAYKHELEPFQTSNIYIEYLDKDEDLNYIQLVNLYCQSSILAIPLTNDDSLCGLTSITDAIGCYMPVLMTYNKYVDLNPQVKNFGNVVLYGNNNDWTNKAQEILDRIADFEAKSSEVGQNHNIKIFTEHLVGCFSVLK